MKILILVDLLNNWALHNRAKALKKFLPEYEICIEPALSDQNWMNIAGHFDLVHFNFSYGLTDYYKWIKEFCNKVVITVVNERSLLIGHGVNTQMFEELLLECQNVTSVSRKIAEMFEHVRYIPNGIDESIFNQFKKPVVGYAGVCDKPNKNVSVIRQACDNLGLEFRGAGYNREELSNHQFPHNRMQEFYNGLDVYVHASLTEGFNNTVIEALACNIPVLMTRQGCWQEFEGWVTFIEPTIESVEEGLKRFVGRKLILEKYLWKNIAKQYGEVYERALARTT